jgi:hypothetical protein
MATTTNDPSTTQYSGMDYNALTNLLGQKRQELGQRIADMPNVEANVRADMFGSDNVTKNLNTQEQSSIDQLFSYDQQVAQQYQQNPGLSATPGGRILDPYARELAKANREKSAATSLTDIRQKQQTRRDVIGESLANALKIAQAALDAKKAELEQLNSDRNFAWDVYKEKNKSSGGGGGQAALGTLMSALMGLQSANAAAAPKKSGQTVQKVGQNGQTKASLMSQIQKQNPGQQIHYTFNKDGTITYAVTGNDQNYVTSEQADPTTPNKMAAASIAAGAPASDVQQLMQYLGLTPQGTTYQTPAKRTTDFQAKISEAQAKINDWRNRQYLPEPEIQGYIQQMVEAAPELNGYIK